VASLLSRGTAWALIVLWGGQSTVLAADTPLGNLVDFFFGGGAEAVQAMEAAAVAEVVAIDANAGGQYLPLIYKAAARELYFLKKLAQPTDEQYEPLKIAAAQAARDLAKEYALAEANGKSSEQWPRPGRYLSDALLKSAMAVLPPEAVAKYREEVEAREAAHEAACQAMMVRAIDNRLTLLPEQYEPLRAAVVKQWNKDQSLNLMIYLYDEYLQLPTPASLSSVLNDRQKSLLKAENHGRIHFGWEQDLGLQGWNDIGQELPGMEDLSQVRVEPAKSVETPAEGGEAKPVEAAAPAARPAAVVVPAQRVETQEVKP
jgi:hypothetical protein